MGKEDDPRSIGQQANPSRDWSQTMCFVQFNRRFYMADRSARVREWYPGILSRFGIACLTCVALAIMMSATVYADCIDNY